MRPTPRWDGTCWRLDLRRPWCLGRYVVDAPAPPLGTVEAIHLARDLLDRLRVGQDSGGQLALPGTAGRTLAQAVRSWLAARSWRRPGGERWTRSTAAAIVRDCGFRALVEFAAPGGAVALEYYRDELRAREAQGRRRIGPAAARDRLHVLRQCLRWCAAPSRLWIAAVPEFPDPRLSTAEAYTVPRDTWIDEATFRIVRDAIYLDWRGRSAMERRHGGAAAANAAIARRRLFLSFAFYAGLRRQDCALLRPRDVSLDAGCMVRFGRKTGVDPAWEKMCSPLLADLRSELRRLHGPTDLLCGGPWKTCHRVLRIAARAAGVPAFNLMDCRRSFAYHNAVAGVSLDDLSRLMGHASSAMLRAIYLRVPPRTLRDTAGAAWPECASELPGTGPARVLAFSTVYGAPEVSGSVSESVPETASLTASKLPSNYPKPRRRRY
jgi:integrase